ncbi:MAG: alanyl-tRNA editing protein [Rhodospirillaceae bacterium]|jgi:misacylated tRNA(Ala) deacylase|nr:alanyl-tRNA editing protein [Rhodospirillaceae bacterium]MBT4042423.1 alanyl-tRNA editing protein [Rhodospirillaceae bacterium]MBT4690413.1 alanyl-tRNA editing protein [Rhodospirillaceae bacterium]MBT5083966.1 alanyl-tRNA editing protein [Rhodospirillaceae bacterium]MBT5523876.1 alanyl-tRNA editing protein [Rhodospirillaceae bacterium]
MTELLFRDDPYTKTCEATITAINERGGIELDRTIFYPTGGGQPGDTGVLRLSDGSEIAIATTVKGDGPDGVIHVPAEGQDVPAVGTTVTAAIDWDVRHRLMRIHTCLHLLSSVVEYPVTGGQISDGKGRLDFDMPEMTVEKDAITERLNELIAQAHPVSVGWISDEELTAQPDLVKTMSVKPPMGQGRVRLIDVDGCDLQPCGGTHVANTSEIGPVRVRKIEKKGKQNRRISIEFSE